MNNSKPRPPVPRKQKEAVAKTPDSRKETGKPRATFEDFLLTLPKDDEDFKSARAKLRDVEF